MCILCDNWAATPCASRPTTDISCNTGHELMLLGFYLGAFSANATEVPPLCAAHEAIMNEIAEHKEGTAAAEAAARAVTTPSEENIALQSKYKQRIASLHVGPAPATPPVPPTFTVQSLGLKVPMQQQSAPTPSLGATLGTGKIPLPGAPIIPPSGGGVMEIPPVSAVDPNMLFECPNCKKQVTNGLVHDCVYVP